MEERLIMIIRPAWLNYIGTFIIALSAIVLSFSFHMGEIGIGLAVIFSLGPIMSRMANIYTITDCRVIERRGLIARRTAEANLEEIVLFNVYQSILERILGLGRIEMMSASDGGPDVVFSGISNPLLVKELIWKLKKEK